MNNKINNIIRLRKKERNILDGDPSQFKILIKEIKPFKNTYNP